MVNYNILESTSELRIEVHGQDLADLFKNAALAMSECMHPSIDERTRSKTYDVSISAIDREVLLIDFLSEVLYICHADKQMVVDLRFDEMADASLTARLTTKDVTRFLLDIKAVTYHDVKIMKNNNGLSTIILFDI